MYYFSILEMMVSIKSLLNMMLMNIPGRYFWKVVIGAGEDVTDGDLQPDDSDVISGELIILESGSYEVKYKKQSSEVLISFTKATFTEAL